MSTSAEIYSHLQDRVVNGDFEPGQRLKSEELAKGYVCAASTIREVLFRLSTVGLVDFLDQRGFRIPTISATARDDLTRFRILLECEGACLSIRNGGIVWEAKLTAAHHKLSHVEGKIAQLPDNSELLKFWTSAELEFHQTLIESCGSENLKQTHSQIYQRFRQQLITSDKKFVFVEENIEQHQGILDAALAHDEELIRERITHHLSRNLISK